MDERPASAAISVRKEFDHDQLGHLLADHLLEVPRFQRSYAWDAGNVDEYLSDLTHARKRDVPYFMGTVVFASPGDPKGRRQIVDGQQRLATTAVLLLAIRDLLTTYGKKQQADETDKRYLRGYVLAQDAYVERLILSPKDQTDYDTLLQGRGSELGDGSPLGSCYVACSAYLKGIAPTAEDYKNLIDVSTQLEKQVQVPVAVATDLPEAYVIFETLNDRGADLTTADLLKNFLFSASGDHFRFVESQWTTLENNFERPEDLAKFIRYEYVSRRGPISGRKLYRAIQADVGGTGQAAKSYINGLVKAQEVYLAIREPESSFWSSNHLDPRDALYAYRRFGFEASTPVLLAAFQKWTKVNATKLLIKLANWSVRAQFTGRLGGGVAEEVFGDTALKISDGTAGNQTKVRALLSRLIPNDAEFRSAFVSFGDVTVSRAKYILAMLEKADDAQNGRADRTLLWYSRSVTIEHVMPQSARNSSEANAAVVNRIGNLALLEKKLNHLAGSKPFADKKTGYKQSQFVLTTALYSKRTWNAGSIDKRTDALADLACRAWPTS